MDALETTAGLAAPGESAVAEMRTGVADAAIGLADEERRAALRCRRIADRGDGVAALERIAEFIERRAAADERLLVGGQRLADVDERLFIILGNGAREGAFIVARIARAHHGSDVRGRCAHLARIEYRPHTLRPQAVVRAVPAVPAILADVDQARRVALDLLEAE